MAEETQIPASESAATRLRRGEPDYLNQYYQQLVGQYRMMARPVAPAAPAQVAAAAEADEIVGRADASKVAWSDIYRLERALLKIAPLPELRRKAWSLRRDFSEVAGQDRYAAYLASNPPNAAEAPEEELRADLEQVLEELHWLYTVLPVQEEVRSSLVHRTLKVTLWALCFFLLLVIVQVFKEGRDVRLQPITIVLVAGAIGGLISTIRRIQMTALDENVVRGLLGMSRSLWSVYLSPLFGAVFAAVLLLMFKGNLLSGELFPAFCAEEVATSQPATCPTTVPVFRHILAHLQPAGTADYAKLLIWAFIAGFAEQLVPDALSRVASRASDGTTTPAKTK